jgi:hypothetical protein
MRTTVVLKVAVLVAAVLATSSVDLTAQPGSIERLRHSTPGQNLAPDAARLRERQQFWPGRPLCDDGGYRIRPCDLARGGG